MIVDILFALIALTGLGTFLAVVIWHVPSPDMVVILGAVGLMCAFDFAREIWQKGRK